MKRGDGGRRVNDTNRSASHLTRRHLLVAGAAGALGALAADATTPRPAEAQKGPVGVGQIPGISSFTGGDGSFKRVLREGITLGIGDDYPFTYLDPKTKQYAGMDVEIFKRVTQMLGIQKVTWEIAEGGQQIPGLIAKRWDVDADNIHENPQRLAVIDFTGPVYWYGSALAVRKGNPKNIHTLSDLAGKIAGTVQGGFDQYVLQSHKELKELKTYPNQEAEFADLVAGRTDVVMEDDIKIGLFIKSHPGAPIEFATGYSPSPQEYGYARYGIRKEDIDLNHAVSRAIAELRGMRNGVAAILQAGGLTLRNMWYWPVA